MTAVADFLRRHLEPSLDMLADAIRLCPDDFWTETMAGYPYWRQMYHALESLDYWLTVKAVGAGGEAYEAQRFGKDVSPELDGDCREVVVKGELLAFLGDLRSRLDSLLAVVGEGDAAAVDALLTQIRHIQYHVGHGDAALRSRGAAPGVWKGYGE